MKQILLLLTICLTSVNAQTQKPTQPDYDAIIKRMTEQVDQMDQKLAEDRKRLTELRTVENIARDVGLTAPRDDYSERPSYYPSYRYYPWLYYPRYYPRVYPRSYFSPFKSSGTYRHTFSPF